MKKRIFLYINSVFPLIVGAFIYYFTSENVIFVEVVDSFLGKPKRTSIIYMFFAEHRFFRYYLLDMLWAYALVFALYLVIGNNAARLKKSFMIAFLFTVIMEFVQLSPIIPGTFDVLDIFAEAAAEAFAALIIYILNEEARNICETK